MILSLCGLHNTNTHDNKKEEKKKKTRKHTQKHWFCHAWMHSIKWGTNNFSSLMVISHHELLVTCSD